MFKQLAGYQRQLRNEHSGAVSVDALPSAAAIFRRN
jgi:hypothetical protein